MWNCAPGPGGGGGGGGESGACLFAEQSVNVFIPSQSGSTCADAQRTVEALIQQQAQTECNRFGQWPFCSYRLARIGGEPSACQGPWQDGLYSSSGLFTIYCRRSW
jgi:hypothetical protein